MSKMGKIIACASLVTILLLSLPYLYLFVSGSIVGSFEMFPRPEDIAAKRTIYIFMTILVILADIIAGVCLIKLVKATRSK